MIRSTVICLLILQIFALTSAYALFDDNRESFSNSVTIPPEWEKINYYVYSLKEYKYSHWRKAILNGNMAWGSNAIEVAAECLMDFGIQDGFKDSTSLSKSLVEVNENTFVLKKGSITYVVYVSLVKAPPVAPYAYVAYKLKIKDESLKHVREMPRVVDHFACSDYCPGPREKHMVKIYLGVDDEDECNKIGGKYSSYYGWGRFDICIAD